MAKMKRFWQERGIELFHPFEVMNRGGALFVDEMQYASYPEQIEAMALFEARGAEPVCPAPFILLFIGYDGQCYLCCSDWRCAPARTVRSGTTARSMPSSTACSRRTGWHAGSSPSSTVENRLDGGEPALREPVRREAKRLIPMRRVS
jgi:hypothetical protein